MKKTKIKKRGLVHALNFFNFSKSPIRSIIALFMLGVSAGVAYEEMYGIGTWHSYNPETEIFNVCFTPPSGCGSLIAQEITKAKFSVYVQAYGLTSHAIINQLKLARKRGVDITVLLDGGNLSDNKDVELELKSADINVYYDKMPGIAHNKVMIIDKQKVITGSFNFTGAADTRNAENVLLIDDRNIATIYLKNWHSRLSHSKKTS